MYIYIYIYLCVCMYVLYKLPEFEIFVQIK